MHARLTTQCMGEDKCEMIALQSSLVQGLPELTQKTRLQQPKYEVKLERCSLATTAQADICLTNGPPEKDTGKN